MGLEAALYDWHNSLRLRALAADGPYWAGALRGARSIAVLGAGTGRVVMALRHADLQRRLVAVDHSAERLERMPAEARAEVVVADFRGIVLAEPVDAAIFPYSAFQLLDDADARRETMCTAAALLADGGLLAIDVSTSFDGRAPHDWARTLHGPCPELGAEIEEWQRVEQEPSALVVRQRYRVGGHDAGEATERWVHHAILDLPDLVAEAGLVLDRLDEGYGAGVASHRRLYLARRANVSSSNG